MFEWYQDFYRKKTLASLRNTNKAVIAIGDSFTQGAGACSVEMWDKYNWNVNEAKNMFNWDYHTSCHDNSFAHQLCKNHLVGFTPINLGVEGRGNRSSVKELYLNPEYKFEQIKEKIVIFMLTGYERFDFVCKDFSQNLHFRSIWPHENKNVPDSDLWENYGIHAFSHRTAIIEMLLAIAEVKSWCEKNNAIFILGSAFRPEYNNRNFLYNKIEFCDEDPDNYIRTTPDYINNLLDIINWETFFKPGGEACISDYLCVLEEREDLLMGESSKNYYDYAYTLEKLSPKGYITNCAHPSFNGHEKIANELYSHILKYHKEEINKNNIINGSKILTNII